ncbi:MAG: hypothetical protein VR77_01385 [Flavobacteriales bacterium BRH_c54]|nr:MAG: hypothetical protein VR77_01385 [Flavobacteriales bacterium BRH_c54]
MLNFLDKYQFIRGQTAFGVEVIYNSKDSYTLIALELIANKEGVKVARKFTDVSLEELAKINTKKAPLYFAVGGKGIVHKKVKTNEHLSEQDLLNQVLPNATLKDFYLQQAVISTFESWVSIVRKDLLNSLVATIQSLHLFGVQIYLGPFTLENCIPLINKSVITTTTHELLIVDNYINQIDSLGSVAGGEEYNIEGEIVNSHELIAFSAALSHFISPIKIHPIVCEEVTHFREEYLHKNKYTVVGFGLLAFFFVLTISNMMIANSYESSNNELQYQLNSKQQFVDELEILKKELLIKEEFIQNSGVTKAAKITFYADQIAMSVPASIQLDQLFINPLTKRINKAEDIQFTYNAVKIIGSVSRSIELNNWIKKLKKYEWVNDINIISFIQDNLKTPGEFELQIVIKQ